MERPNFDLLDFGTSVSVNDEMRRGLVTESTHLQESLQKLQAGLQTQSKVHAQLVKDESMARQETQELGQGAAETLRDLVLLANQVFRPLMEHSVLPELSLPSPQEEANQAFADEQQEEQRGQGNQEEETSDTPMADENAPPPLDEEQVDDEDSRRMPPPPKRSLPGGVNLLSMAGMRHTHNACQEDVRALLYEVGRARKFCQEWQQNARNAKAQLSQVSELVEELKKQMTKTEKTTKSYAKGRQKEEARYKSFAIKLATLQEAFTTLSEATYVLVSSIVAYRHGTSMTEPMSSLTHVYISNHTQ
jgi:hypothetical protein